MKADKEYCTIYDYQRKYTDSVILVLQLELGVEELQRRIDEVMKEEL